jgi:hypothetical protein
MDPKSGRGKLEILNDALVPWSRYNLTVTFTPTGGGPTIVTTRRVGFRMFALVTGNDTDTAWVEANKE